MPNSANPAHFISSIPHPINTWTKGVIPLSTEPREKTSASAFSVDEFKILLKRKAEKTWHFFSDSFTQYWATVPSALTSFFSGSYQKIDTACEIAQEIWGKLPPTFKDELKKWTTIAVHISAPLNLLGLLIKFIEHQYLSQKIKCLQANDPHSEAFIVYRELQKSLQGSLFHLFDNFFRIINPLIRWFNTFSPLFLLPYLSFFSSSLVCLHSSYELGKSFYKLPIEEKNLKITEQKLQELHKPFSAPTNKNQDKISSLFHAYKKRTKEAIDDHKLSIVYNLLTVAGTGTVVALVALAFFGISLSVAFFWFGSTLTIVGTTICILWCLKKLYTTATHYITVKKLKKELSESPQNKQVILPKLLALDPYFATEYIVQKVRKQRTRTTPSFTENLKQHKILSETTVDAVLKAREEDVCTCHRLIQEALRKPCFLEDFY